MIVSMSTNSIFRLLADNTSVSATLDAIQNNCTTFANFKITNGTAYVGSADGSVQPESAVQYYRASSMALTLDGYNNTAAPSNDTKVLDSPLPKTVDFHLLECLNSTIGLSVPLVDQENSGGFSLSTTTKVAIIVPAVVIFLAITLGCIMRRNYRRKSQARRGARISLPESYHLQPTHEYLPVPL